MDALIPPPRDDDDEDVYLALQTAKALWSRNEREDALRWLRRAAEQASDANADDRALELFKAAAEMASRLQATATPSVPPVRSGGPPPPPNRAPVELAPGPRGAAAAPPMPPGRPPPPGAQASTAPPPPARLSSMPPAHTPSAPPAAYGPPPPVPGAGGPGYPAPPGYDAAGRAAPAYPSSPAPPARPAPIPSRPPGPPGPPPSGVNAVPLLRPKNPGGMPQAQQGQRPQPQPYAPAPPGRPAPAQPQVPQVPQAGRGPQPDAARADDASYRRAGGTMLGPAVVPPTTRPASLDADYEDESSDAPTKVGTLPPEFRQQAIAAAQTRAAQPVVPPPPQQPAGQPPRKARRKTLSRGEQSPLSAGARRPDARDPRGGQPDARDPRDGRAHHDGRAHPPEGRGAPAAAPHKARDGAGRSAQLPSEVPTAPGTDARAGAARAAALRALARADDEVTAQRDISVLERLRELRVDDLDEDTSVLPGLKLDAEGRAVGPASSGGRDGKRNFDDDATRRVTERELAQGLAAIKRARDPYTATTEDDRPTPTDADQDLSATSPPDTSRTSAAGVEMAALDSTARYSAIDAAWITGAAAADGPGGAPVRPAGPAPAPAAPSAASGRAATPASPAPARATTAASPTGSVATAAAASAASVVPLRAFRVVVLGPDPAGSGVLRVVPLAPGARPPAGSTPAMLVPTTEAESAELARLFGLPS